MVDAPIATPRRLAAPGRNPLSSWVLAAGRTVLSVAVTLFGLAALTFFIGRMLPLDPVAAILGDNATQAAYDAMYRQLGLDQPIWIQFLRYLRDIVSLDLGTALTTGKPVVEDIARVFPATLELATVAILIGTGLGIPFGVLAAMYRDSAVDHIVRVVGLLGYSAPTFWLGLMGLVLFYATLGWVGGPGRIDFMYEYDIEPMTGFLLLDTALQGQWEAFGNVFSHVILPASI
ncbi:MAG TPA: ABC transporter permease, partial [Inquilinus sp.]|nr:ABC transporter permease [Inquilinus sp.]